MEVDPPKSNAMLLSQLSIALRAPPSLRLFGHPTVVSTSKYVYVYGEGSDADGLNVHVPITRLPLVIPGNVSTENSVAPGKYSVVASPCFLQLHLLSPDDTSPKMSFIHRGSCMIAR